MKKLMMTTTAFVLLVAGAAQADPIADALAQALAGTQATDFAVTFANVHTATETGVETYGFLDSAWYEADSNGETGGASIAFDGAANMASLLDLDVNGEADGGWIVPSNSSAALDGAINSQGTGGLVIIGQNVTGEVNVDGFDTTWFPDDANGDGSGVAVSEVNAVTLGGQMALATALTVSSMEVSIVEFDGFN